VLTQACDLIMAQDLRAFVSRLSTICDAHI
jgi:hypothetical protein